MATKQSLQVAVDGAMLEAVARLRQALEAARHELQALHGLYAYDGAAPGEPWQLDLAVPLAQIDLALAGAGPAVEAAPVQRRPVATLDGRYTALYWRDHETEGALGRALEDGGGLEWTRCPECTGVRFEHAANCVLGGRLWAELNFSNKRTVPASGGMTPEAIRAAIHTMRTRMNSSPVYLKPTERMDAPEGMIPVSTTQTPDPGYVPPLADELLSIREWLERHHAELGQGEYTNWRRCDCVLCVAIGRLDMLGRRMTPNASPTSPPVPGFPAASPPTGSAFQAAALEAERRRRGWTVHLDHAHYREMQGEFIDDAAPAVNAPPVSGTAAPPRPFARPRHDPRGLTRLARAAHDAFFGASFEPWDFVSGVERELWHQVAAAVLEVEHAVDIDAGALAAAGGRDETVITLADLAAAINIPVSGTAPAPGLCPWCGYAANISAHGDGVCNRTDGVKPRGIAYEGVLPPVSGTAPQMQLYLWYPELLRESTEGGALVLAWSEDEARELVYAALAPMTESVVKRQHLRHEDLAAHAEIVEPGRVVTFQGAG